MKEDQQGRTIRLNTTMNDWKVEFRGVGRGGTVVYRENDHSASFWWELGGRDVVFIISGVPPQGWNEQLPWAANRQAEVMSRIASEVIRQEAPGCTFDLGDANATAIIRKRNR